MNSALLQRLVTTRPLWINALLRQPCSRWSSSTASDEIRVDPAVFERYEGPIVISGISGRFPSASNNKEFIQKLLNGEEMTTETSTRYDNELFPARFGFLNCLDKFDANFFSLIPRQAHQLDPQMRLLMEASFEAIIDAGMSPTGMRGSRTAVFSGAYGGEALPYTMFRQNNEDFGYQGLTSMSFMIPGRVAFALDLQGPTSHVSTACSSSFTALETAVCCIMLGKCDAAIVTGSTLHLDPQNHFDLVTLGALAKDGRSRTFDDAATGFVRSEAAVAMLIQKEKDAKRNYATILNIRSRSDGFKHEGIMFPSTKSQEILLKETYAQIGMDPADVSYLEAHGTGTPSGDPQELQAVHNTFCKDKKRRKPLLIGSVKTNLGHTEGAAGLTGVSKVIGAIQTGIIPKHLWFKKPKAEIEHLFDGSLEVVTEPTPFDGGIVGISSFGISGTNYHLILQPGPVHVDPPLQELPILFPFSGRSAGQVEESIKEAAQSAHNPEFVHLLHSAFQRDIRGHAYRGFGLLKHEQVEPFVSVENCDSCAKPVWVVFPGMGSQWNEMGKDLMKIQPFAESISRTRATLKNLGIDLDELLKAGNQAIFNDIHYAVLSITAMQMALYDTIKEIGLMPEGFIGHSTGESLCAYADGCFNAEETLCIADARGRALKESQKVIGAMASIGLSWEQVQARLPPDLELACHNAEHNVTVSGPADSVGKFVETLKKEDKFVVTVNSCGIAAHSTHVQDAADRLQKYAADIIKGDRPRSSRWISTSIAEADWGTPVAKYASPEYFANNTQAPVLFYEALQHVPSRSLVIEVSPKGFFQALLKGTVPNDCVHVAPMTVKAEDKLEHFFRSIGQIYTSGVEVHIDKLYPAVTLPVSSNTPSLAHLVKWDHEASWKTSVLTYPVVRHTFQWPFAACAFSFLHALRDLLRSELLLVDVQDVTVDQQEAGAESKIDLDDPRFAYLKGHKVENRILLPATGYLEAIWRQLSVQMGLSFENTAVVFTNVTFRRATVLQEAHTTNLFSQVNCSSGRFIAQNEGDIVATGTIERLPKGTRFSPEIPEVPTSEYLPLNKTDVYKEFKLRGYNYTGIFQGIHEIDNEGRWAYVAWTGDWASFLDTLLQTSLLSTTARSLMVPVDIEEITIDPVEFKKHLKDPPEGQEHPLVRVVTLPNQGKIVAPGIEIKGLQPTVVPRKGQRGNLAYEAYTFCPFIQTSTEGLMEPFVWEMVDLVLDNCRAKDLQVVDVFTNKDSSMARLYQEILMLKPQRESKVSMQTLVAEADKMDDKEKKIAKLVTKERPEELVPDAATDFVMLDDPALLPSIIQSLKPSGFVLLQSPSSVELTPADAELVSQKLFDGNTLSLYRKVTNSAVERIIHVAVDSESFSWIAELQAALRRSEEEAAGRIYITSQKNPSSGVLGLISCLRKEEGGERIRCIFDPEATLTLDFLNRSEQLQAILKQDLAITVVKGGQMGSYRHVPLETETAGVMKKVEHGYLLPLVPGDLSSLSWMESPLVNYVQQPPSSPDKLPAEKLYQVAYAAMNFRDVLLATGALPLQPEFSYKGPYLGFEFSGFDNEGNRVMGMTQGKGLATSAACDPRFVWKVPDKWTLEQAATVPIVYSTVLYAFHTRGRIEPGQTVLIHAGTGGVGQAAIAIALSHGCTVLTTVGSPEKREFIKKLYPQIKDEHIGNSRDRSFEAQFMEVTNGRGVDVVLNSLAGDKLQATLRCLAVNGKFLEIGVFDAFMNTPVGLRPFLKNIDFAGVTLFNVMGDNIAQGEVIWKQLDDGIKSGAVQPLNSHVFENDQVEDASRFMATGKHTGKILIRIRDETNCGEPVNLATIGRCYFPADKTYVIVGGLGGFGLEVANWLVERGARHLLLTSRSGVTTGYQSLCLRKWKQLGVTVEAPVLDLTDRQAADSFLSKIAHAHKIGGIFNSALILKDETFANQTPDSFHQVSVPKAVVTQVLDDLSRKHCPDLDYFVVFSSAACGLGNSEQSNYGWANAVMERICENRKADGLHGLAIQWGVIGQVGFVAEKLLKNMDETTELVGTLPQNVDSCLEVLDAALRQNSAVVSSMVVAEKGNKKADRASLLARIEKIFGIKDIDSISPDKKLSELGMDSLVAVELKQTFDRDYDLALTKELLLSLTVSDVKAMDAGTFDPARVGKQTGGNLEEGLVPYKLHNKCLIKLHTGLDRPALFIIHGIDGSADRFRPLARKLNVDVYGLQFTSKYDPKSVSSIAEGYLKEIQAAVPGGPYNIAGFSGGATVAYEISQQLRQGGDEVTNLVLLDGCPCYGGTTEEVVKSVPRLVLESMNLYSKIPEQHREEFDNSLTGHIENDVQVVLNLWKELGFAEFDSKMVTNYIQLCSAVQEYEPREQYAGKLVLIQASERSVYTFGVPNEDYNVNQFCMGSVSRHKVAGDHWSFLKEDHVEETARIMNQLFQS